jgi:hypothetical protein
LFKASSGKKQLLRCFSTNIWAQWRVPVIPTMQKVEIWRIRLGGWWSMLAWAKKADTVSKTTNAKRDGRVVQVVECLPSKSKCLRSILGERKRERGREKLEKHGSGSRSPT